MALIRALSVSLWLLFPSILLADDFRGGSWGDSIETVKEEASAPIEEEGDFLLYDRTIAGVDMHTFYQFLNGSLVRAGYSSTESYINKNKYIDDYKKIKNLLSKKYGEPDIDDVVWRKGLYKDDASGWGTAISIGHLVYRAKWETDTTSIVTGLRGDNFEITHIVIYRAKAAEEDLRKQEEEQALDQL